MTKLKNILITTVDRLKSLIVTSVLIALSVPILIILGSFVAILFGVLKKSML
jgi:hypothetical protein